MGPDPLLITGLLVMSQIFADSTNGTESSTDKAENVENSPNLKLKKLYIEVSSGHSHFRGP